MPIFPSEDGHEFSEPFAAFLPSRTSSIVKDFKNLFLNFFSKIWSKFKTAPKMNVKVYINLTRNHTKRYICE